MPRELKAGWAHGTSEGGRGDHGTLRPRTRIHPPHLPPTQPHGNRPDPPHLTPTHPRKTTKVDLDIILNTPTHVQRWRPMKRRRMVEQFYPSHEDGNALTHYLKSTRGGR